MHNEPTPALPREGEKALIPNPSLFTLLAPLRYASVAPSGRPITLFTFNF